MKKILATAMLAFALLAVPACSMRAGVNHHRTRLHRHTPSSNHVVQGHRHRNMRRDRHHDRGHGHQKHRQQHSGQRH